jgi:hypothetical protein
VCALSRHGGASSSRPGIRNGGFPPPPKVVRTWKVPVSEETVKPEAPTSDTTESRLDASSPCARVMAIRPALATFLYSRGLLVFLAGVVTAAGLFLVVKQMTK